MNLATRSLRQPDLPTLPRQRPPSQFQRSGPRTGCEGDRKCPTPSQSVALFAHWHGVSVCFTLFHCIPDHFGRLTGSRFSRMRHLFHSSRTQFSAMALITLGAIICEKRSNSCLQTLSAGSGLVVSRASCSGAGKWPSNVARKALRNPPENQAVSG